MPSTHRSNYLHVVTQRILFDLAIRWICARFSAFVSATGLESQSFQFLIAVSEFKSSVHATDGGSEGSEGGYDKFMVIVNEYIKGNSNSEVNISSKIREEILAFSEHSAYMSLRTVRRR